MARNEALKSALAWTMTYLRLARGTFEQYLSDRNNDAADCRLQGGLKTGLETIPFLAEPQQAHQIVVVESRMTIATDESCMQILLLLPEVVSRESFYSPWQSKKPERIGQD